MERTKGYYNTFVVKIWCDEDEGIMRGHIQHVSTQEQTYFLNLESVIDFIAGHLSSPPNGSVTKDKTLGVSLLLAEDFGDVGQDE